MSKWTLDSIYRSAVLRMFHDEPIGLDFIVNCALDQLSPSTPELISFVDRCLENVLRSGGRPCIPGYPDWEQDWVEEPRYGQEPDGIRKAVLEEWVGQGAGEIRPWTAVFFGTPEQVTRQADVSRRVQPIR